MILTFVIHACKFPIFTHDKSFICANLNNTEPLKHGGYQSFNLCFQDESRFGLFTKNGKSLTVKGVKPICPYQQVFKSTYLFGAFSHKDEIRFLLELPHCNGDVVQLFLNKLSQRNKLPRR